MSDKIKFLLEGKECTGKPGQSILQAADDNGVYIPRLCYHPDLKPGGSCRVCTVNVNGRNMAACTTPVADGMVILNETEELRDLRRALVEMLFIEGNHYCPFCEKSGNCELQALAYRFGIAAPRYPYLFPKRDIDFSHPDIYIDRNRCVLCGRCVRASRETDKKVVFEFTGRGAHRRLGIDAAADLADTDAAVADKSVEVCPVGALMRKRVGYAVPVGQRKYDHKPIGSDIEAKRA